MGRRRCAALLVLLVLCAEVSADTPNLPGSVDVPDYARPISAGIAINTNAMAFCQSLNDSASSLTAGTLSTQAGKLIEILQQLHKLDASIQVLGAGFGDEGLRGVRAESLQYRTAAWLNAWWAFGLLSERVSQISDQQIRMQLLGLREDCAFGLLLRVYVQIRQGETVQLAALTALRDQLPDGARRSEIVKWLNDNQGQLDEPIQLRLASSDRLPFLLQFPPDFQVYDGLAVRSSVPAVADLIGTVGDAPTRSEPSAHRVILSLWALINLQLDTCRGDEPTAPGGISLIQLSQWLGGLAHASLAAAFDRHSSQLGTGMRARALRLSKYAEFRHKVQDPNAKSDVVAQLVRDRSAQRPCTHPLLTMLADAARPIDAEVLCNADIWLRYLFLLSYSGARPVTFSDPQSAFGPQKYWSTCGFPSSFAAKPFTQRQTLSLCRWNYRPGKDHFDCVLDRSTRGIFRYIVLDADSQQSERKRFVALADSAQRPQYAALCDARAAALGEVFSSTVAHYVASFHSSYNINAPGAHPILSSYSLNLNRGLWASQASAMEQLNLQHDVALIASQLLSMKELHETLAIAYRTTDPNAFAGRVHALASYLGGVEWDPTVLPKLDFDSYKAQVADALADLDGELQKLQVRDDLIDKYQSRKDDADIRELEFASAELGLTIAQKGQELASTLQQASLLNLKIANLRKQVAELDKSAADHDLAAAGKRLQLAQRTRDLAAAQLDALLAAQDKASEMVKEASTELEALRPKLHEIAQQIDDSKKSSFLSVLRAVVKVVAVAVAPFTGGASLAIGAIADQSLGIVDQLSHANWSNPLNALSTLGNAVVGLEKVDDLAIGQFGGADIKKTWGDIKGWVNAQGNEAQKLTSDAKTFIDNIRNLPLAQFQQVAGRLATAAALDLPISYDGSTSKLSIDLGTNGVRITDNKLRDALKGLLSEGGMIAAGIQQRVSGIADLTGLSEPDQRKRLEDAINEFVQTMPAGLQKDVQQANAAVASRRQELNDFAKTATPAGRQLLSQILSGNLVVVIDASGAVTAVERQLASELSATRERIEAYKESVFNDTIKSIVDKLKADSDKLNAKISDAENAQDEGELRRIAQDSGPDGISATVATVKGELDGLQEQIDMARGTLQDDETKVDVAQQVSDASELRAQAANILKQIGLLDTYVAQYQRDAENIQVVIADLTKQQKAIRLEAATDAMDASRNALERTYLTCLRWGIDPSQPTGAANANGLSGLMMIGGPSDPESRNRNGRLTYAAQGLIGMIQWLRLIGQGNPKVANANEVALQHYEAVVETIYQTVDSPAAPVQKLSDTSTKLGALIDGVTLPNPFLGYSTNEATKLFTWFTDEIDADHRDAMFADIPLEYRQSVVGKSTFLIGTTEPSVEQRTKPGFGGYIVVDNSSTDGCYIFPDRVTITCPDAPVGVSPANFIAFVASSSGSRVSPSLPFWADSSMPSAKTDRLLADLTGLLVIGDLKRQLGGIWNGALIMRPALGEWNVYIVAIGKSPAGMTTEKWRMGHANNFANKSVHFTLQVPAVEFLAPK